ncbi:MAG: TerC family protein [Methylococcaceae bacterium]|nr:TerC family protein [Methylococcaceae bacterium]
MNITAITDPASWLVVGQIIAIDILLGGDNAVVIALACRRLPEPQRRRGIFWGVFGAIALRLVLIFFALQLLGLTYLKLVGAALLLWIGVKLLQPEQEDGRGEIHAGTHLLAAVKTIVVADAMMSLDNVVAVAGAARGDITLVVFGILASVPIIVWGSKFVLKLMDRFPVVVTLGGALLGWIAGEMAYSDIALAHWTTRYPSYFQYVAAVSGAAVVIAVGLRLAARSRSLAASAAGSN